MANTKVVRNGKIQMTPNKKSVKKDKRPAYLWDKEMMKLAKEVRKIIKKNWDYYKQFVEHEA